jgi:hypothetical protein
VALRRKRAVVVMYGQLQPTRAASASSKVCPVDSKVASLPVSRCQRRIATSTYRGSISCLLQHVPTAVNRDSQDTLEVRV